MKWEGCSRRGYVRLIITEDGKRYSRMCPASFEYTKEFVNYLWETEKNKFKPHYLKIT